MHLSFRFQVHVYIHILCVCVHVLEDETILQANQVNCLYYMYLSTMQWSRSKLTLTDVDSFVGMSACSIVREFCFPLIVSLAQQELLDDASDL